MAIPAYMEIDGIPGSVNVAGREGTVEVLEFNHRVYLPPIVTTAPSLVPASTTL